MPPSRRSASQTARYDHGADAPAPQRKKGPKEVVVTEIPEDGLNVLADDISKLSDAFRQLINSRLSKRAVVVLLKDMLPQVNITEIKLVLEALPLLKETYVKKWAGGGAKE